MSLSDLNYCYPILHLSHTLSHNCFNSWGMTWWLCLLLATRQQQPFLLGLFTFSHKYAHLPFRHDYLKAHCTVLTFSFKLRRILQKLGKLKLRLILCLVKVHLLMNQWKSWSTLTQKISSLIFLLVSIWIVDRFVQCFCRYIRLIVVEVLRLYPQPPLLIRRTLKPETLPGMFQNLHLLSTTDTNVLSLTHHISAITGEWLSPELIYLYFPMSFYCLHPQEDTKVKKKVIKFQKGLISSFL